VTALQTPAPDAPAEEWGALAVSIPDWRWPWTCSHTEVCPPMPGFVWLEGAWCYTDDITSAARIRVSPDPDHWAWEGWLRRMLGDTFAHISTDGDGYVACIIVDGDTMEGTGRTIGRAAIAAAGTNGRWPGGGE